MTRWLVRAVYITLAAAAAACTSPAPGFDLQGHRGARGLAPENTLAAFEAASRIGVHTWEFDLNVTADGVLVVHHDPRLNPNIVRGADGRWVEPPGLPIHALTLAELQRHDVGRLKPGTRYAQDFALQQPHDGARIPTLMQVFELAERIGSPELRFNIETKLSPLEPGLAPSPEAFAAQLVDAIRRRGLAHRSTVQSFDWRTLQVVHRLAPEIATAALSSRRTLDEPGGRWTAGITAAAHHGSTPRMVKALGAKIWSPNHAELDEAQVREARSLGIKVVPYTVNDPTRMALLLDWKVDGLITDRPDLARGILAARGLPLPAPRTAP